MRRALAALIIAVLAIGGVDVLRPASASHAGPAAADLAASSFALRPPADVANRSFQRQPLDDVHAIRQALAVAQVRAAARAHAKALAEHRRLLAQRAARARALAAAAAVSSSAEGWAHQYFSIRVSNCESGGTPQGNRYDGDIHAVNPSGYYGKWQFALGTWASVGGVGNPAYASEYEQDYRAWLLWKRDGWSPWQCAGMV